MLDVAVDLLQCLSYPSLEEILSLSYKSRISRIKF